MQREVWELVCLSHVLKWTFGIILHALWHLRMILKAKNGTCQLFLVNHQNKKLFNYVWKKVNTKQQQMLKSNQQHGKKSIVSIGFYQNVPLLKSVRHCSICHNVQFAHARSYNIHRKTDYYRGCLKYTHMCLDFSLSCFVAHWIFLASAIVVISFLAGLC